MSRLELLMAGFIAGVLTMTLVEVSIAIYKRDPRERRRYLSPTGEHPYAVSRQRARIGGARGGFVAPEDRETVLVEDAIIRPVGAQRSNPRGGNS